MKKHKNLSKQELMTRQDIPCVQLGGKFVSLKSKTEARQGGSRKKQAEQLLATVVMGMNLVNTAAPLAVLATAEQKLSAVPQPVRSEAEPLDYAVLPQLADVVDRAIFARTEAADYDGNASVTDMVDGDSQTITAGQSGTVSTMSGGEQNISSGGTGTISTMNSGNQNIYNGTGIVIAMNGGTQTIFSGGTGTISSLLGGTQLVSNGGTALDTVIAGGTQIVSSGGTSLDTLLNSGGTVYQKSGGMISRMVYSGGVQIIENISTGYDGMTLGSGGTNVTMGVISGAQMSGTIINSGGEQLVLNGGTALDTELNGGSLQISSGGIVSSLTLTSGSLELENINGGNFTVSGTLTANNATVDMTDSSIKRVVPSVAYETLTIDKLSGNGTTFIMDTDLSGETNSDKITITDADAGTHYVQIKDLSRLNDIEVTGAHQQILITDASGKLTFEGKEFNAGGLWDVDPTLAKQGNDWYLTKLEKKANNDTRVLLDAADNSYALWRNTNDSLRSRLGALASGSEQSDGIWARTQAGRFSGDN